jgi:putative SOS response-associated peptidase YedK
MCGRTVFASSQEIVKELGVLYDGEPIDENLNAPPGAKVPMLSNKAPDKLQYFLWSILQKFNTTGKPDPKFKTFNAKFENLFTSKTWKPLIEAQTCVFITNGFYEWQKLEPEKAKGKKQIHFICEKGQRLTFMAGLWDIWVNKNTGEIIPNCSMITHDANKFMLDIHTRMPAFIERKNISSWMDNSIPVAEKLKLINPVNDDFLEAFKMESVGDAAEFKKIPQFCDWE